jgi:hypothetical protein
MLCAMRKLAGLLALAFVLMPAAAFAQTEPAPNPWPSGHPHPDLRAIHQMHEQLTQLYRTTRTKMLDALTPQHRQLLADVVGQLAISPDPNRRAAAEQLDAALTPAEKQAVLSIHQNAIEQMHTLMQQAFPNAPAHSFPYAAQRHTPSAGELLLTTASNEMHPIEYHPMGPGGPQRGPRMPSPAAS